MATTTKPFRVKYAPPGMLTDLLAALPHPLDPAAFVFPRYENPGVLTRAFTRHAARVGLPGLTFHDLRHDAASTLTAAGVSQRAVMEVLGHRDPRMTIRYQHLAPGTCVTRCGRWNGAERR